MILFIFERNKYSETVVDQESRISEWASDSVGNYDDYYIERKRYKALPKLTFLTNSGMKNSQLVKNAQLAYEIVQNIRLCDHIFVPNRGNRSCFDKCD